MEYINIFVYGSLKRGYGNHNYFCKNMINCVPCTTKGTLYDTGYGFPALDLNGEQVVHGELITVPLDDLPAFDYLEGVPRLYQRNKIIIDIDGDKKESFVYTMNCSKKGFRKVESGNW